MLKDDIKKVLISEAELDSKIREIGAKISKDYAGKEPLVVGLLKGVIPFLGDLIKTIDCYCEVDFLRVRSYEGTSSTGNVSTSGYIPDVKGKDIILVDDILDTGNTLKKIKNLFLNAGAKSVKVCVLLDKPEGRKVDIYADYFCFEVPNEFVVGYGLDFNQKYRNLPYVGVLKEEVYKR